MSNQELKDLQTEWYKKLKDQGFEDIEQPDGNLKTWHSMWLHKHTPETFRAKETYYRMATNFLNDYAFLEPLDKAIWVYVVDGMSAQDMLPKLRLAGFKTHLNAIYKRMRELSKIMLEAKHDDSE